MRDEFLRELEALNSDLVRMSNLVINAITNAVSSLTTANTKFCTIVYGYEQEINKMEKEIDARCSSLFIKQTPMASDFIFIHSAQKMIIDLERIGDNAEDIARISERLADKVKIKEYVTIPQMAEETIKIVRISLDAFINKEPEKIENMEELDDKVDAMFCKVRDELKLIILKAPELIETALDILMIAKYFEKIADHAVNIANYVRGSI